MVECAGQRDLVLSCCLMGLTVMVNDKEAVMVKVSSSPRGDCIDSLPTAVGIQFIIRTNKAALPERLNRCLLNKPCSM